MTVHIVAFVNNVGNVKLKNSLREIQLMANTSESIIVLRKHLNDGDFFVFCFLAIRNLHLPVRH